jgi:hypothetical protein
MADKTMVKLVNKNASKPEDAEKEFDIKHAERILKLQKEKGFDDWQLAENSGFKNNDGTIEPTNTGTPKESGSKGSNK